MISITILTKNSAATLGATLDACKNFPEVILYDTGSTDSTLQIAKNYGNVQVVKGNFVGFGSTHNQAIEAATYPWILSIDSDEVLSPELSAEILSLSLDPKVAYSLDRHNFFNGRRMKCCAGWYPDRIVRLFSRETTRFSNDAVHEKVLTEGLRTLSLKGALLHYPYRTIDQFLAKMQVYSSLFAEQNSGKKKSSLGKAVRHAFAAFLKNYLLKRGIFGGKEGLIISLYNAHTAYYKYLKLAMRNKEL